MATKKAKCKHQHECESCIREEIKALESKLNALKAKLPAPTVINICNHGCHGYCNHWNTYPYNKFYQGIGITNAIGSSSTLYLTDNSTSGSNYNALG